MNFKRRYLAFFFILIILIPIALYRNNTQKTSFRYFIWTIQEVSIGKLISISFFSGLAISFFMNNINNSNLNNKTLNYPKEEENYDPISSDKIENNMDVPPQRDLRDVQPTISVNYRVVKNTEKNNVNSDQNYSNYSDNDNDWEKYNNDNEW
tara:strand:- start:884 stop:1339 length:456 start_codon:yes stop_codon:yes gene_type:complete